MHNATIKNLAKTAFLIGPEGGLSPNEIEILTAKGAQKISLGLHVLRTETAALAALCAWQVSIGKL